MYFYTLTVKSDKEITKAVPFIVASKRIKYLGMKLIKKENHEAVEATVITDQGNRTPCPLVIFQESGPCTGTAETYSPEQ